MWFITLIVLAIAAFFIIKAYKAHAEKQSAEAPSLPDSHTATPAQQQESSHSTTATSEAAHTSEPATQRHSSTLANDPALNTQDSLHNIREMIKILNLAEPDARRLLISQEEFTALRQGDTNNAPSGEALDAVDNRLRHMIA